MRRSLHARALASKRLGIPTERSALTLNTYSYRFSPPQLPGPSTRLARARPFAPPRSCTMEASRAVFPLMQVSSACPSFQPRCATFVRERSGSRYRLSRISPYHRISAVVHAFVCSSAAAFGSHLTSIGRVEQLNPIASMAAARLGTWPERTEKRPDAGTRHAARRRRRDHVVPFHRCFILGFPVRHFGRPRSAFGFFPVRHF